MWCLLLCGAVRGKFDSQTYTALREAFIQTHAYVLAAGATSGATAIVALLIGKKLYVANAGDARGVKYGRETGAVRLSIDHRAGDDVEAQRIRKAGGFVSDDDRVCGVLAVARAIGTRALDRRCVGSWRQCITMGQCFRCLWDILTVCARR